MRNTIYDLVKKLTSLAVNTQALADNIHKGKKSPLNDLDQAKVLGSLGNIIDKEVIKICEYVTNIEIENDVLSRELHNYEEKINVLEKEVNALSLGGYAWK